jgi:hypothetical protein
MKRRAALLGGCLTEEAVGGSPRAVVIELK